MSDVKFLWPAHHGVKESHLRPVGVSHDMYRSQIVYLRYTRTFHSHDRYWKTETETEQKSKQTAYSSKVMADYDVCTAKRTHLTEGPLTD